jgi:hypothetical protein
MPLIQPCEEISEPHFRWEEGVVLSLSAQCPPRRKQFCALPSNQSLASVPSSLIVAQGSEKQP